MRISSDLYDQSLVSSPNLVAGETSSARSGEPLEVLRRKITLDLTFDQKRDLLENKKKALRKIINDRMVGASLDLRNVDLSGMKLDKINLVGANLSGANLAGAKLFGVQLEGADLRGANLSKSCLVGANLLKANLSDADLGEASIRYNNLGGVILNRANLARAQVCENNFVGADMTGADLSDIDLRNVYLNDVTMNGVHLCGSKLQGVSMNKVRLVGANLSGVDLGGLALNNVDLSDANLCGVNLSSASLKEVDLAGSYLIGAQLDEVSLKGLNLKGARLNGVHLNCLNLDGVELEQLNLRGAYLSLEGLIKLFLEGFRFRYSDLSGIQLENAESRAFSMEIGIDADSLDVQLNHINNGSSLLTAIDSIDSRYESIKTTLASLLVTRLQGVDTSSVRESLIEILYKPPYTNVESIAVFINQLVEQHMETYDSSVMPTLSERMHGVCVNFFSTYEKGEFFPKMLFHNGAFTQFVMQGAYSEDVSRQQVAQHLYGIYLKNEFVNRHAKIDHVYGDFNGEPDWADKLACNYILCSAKDGKRVMMLCQADLEGALNFGEDHKLPNFYLFDDGNEMAANDYALNKLFEEDFKIFSAPYESVSILTALKAVLSTLALGNDYEARILSAFGEKFLSRGEGGKLVGNKQQSELSNRFDQKLNYDAETGRHTLKDEHYRDLVEVFGSCGTEEHQVANALLGLAAVFVRCSSSGVFGTEEESPEAFRKYASALMIKACCLDLTILSDETFTDWTNRLLGLNGAFSCTAVLSSMMFDYMKAKFPVAFVKVTPPAWR